MHAATITPEGEFFLFSATWRGPLPLVRLSRQKYAKPRAADRRKARTLNWTKPPTLLGEGQALSLGRNMPKKKKGKRKKNMNHFSQELGVRTSGRQCASSGC